MTSAGDVCLCILLVVLLVALFYLRGRLPAASTAWQAAALAAAATVFLSACSALGFGIR